MLEAALLKCAVVSGEHPLSQFDEVLQVDFLRFEAPVLNEWNRLDSGVDSGHGADLLGHINTLLGPLQLGDHLGSGGADLLGLQVALLLGDLHDHRLHPLQALHGTLQEGRVSS